MMDRVLVEAIRVTKENMEKSPEEVKKAYEDYLSIFRDISGRMGELLAKMRADGIVDPREIEILFQRVKR
jgi:hypothetical protein